MFDYFEKELAMLPNNYSSNYKDVIKYFDCKIIEYNDIKKNILKKIRFISIHYKLDCIHNKINAKVGLNQLYSFSLNELVFYKEKLELINTYLTYQVKLLSILDKVNFSDVYNFSIFINIYFRSNDNYLNDKINYEWIQFNRKYKNLYNGLVHNSLGEYIDTRIFFDKYFNYKYNELTSSNIYKKML